MAAIFESDDRLAAAMQENEKLRADIRILRERLNGKMNECVELNRLLRNARRQLDKIGGQEAS